MKSTKYCPELPPSAPSLSRILACCSGLLAFGLAYDQISSSLLRRDWGEQKSSLFVVVGVATTVMGMMPLIGWRAARWLLLGFAASGTPMIAGQFRRYARNIRRARSRMTDWS